MMDIFSKIVRIDRQIRSSTPIIGSDRDRRIQTSTRLKLGFLNFMAFNDDKLQSENFIALSYVQFFSSVFQLWNLNFITQSAAIKNLIKL